MHRNITNVIRFVLDECIPPVIRDSRWFMYPFFYIWYKGKNVKTYMDFKRLVPYMTEDEYAKVYEELDCLATDRPTDMNTKCINHMLRNMDPEAESMVDIGCGRGYFLDKVKELGRYELHGCDIMSHVDLPNASFHQGNMEHLPFRDEQFDIVTTAHTLEHVLNPEKAVAELKRITRKQLMVVVPKQRYYFYTMDMHIHFFEYREKLTSLIGMDHYTCENIWGDWVYIGTKK